VALLDLRYAIPVPQLRPVLVDRWANLSRRSHPQGDAAVPIDFPILKTFLQQILIAKGPRIRSPTKGALRDKFIAVSIAGAA
jgi:hypothetical protein